MISVFLVEDEFIVREGIKNMNWEAYGLSFVGEASDGELAFPLNCITGTLCKSKNQREKSREKGC